MRGWLEFNHSQRPQLEEVLARSSDDLLNGGWAWPSRPFTWTPYLRYGGNVREGAVVTVREWARLDPGTSDGDMPAGFFLLSDERQQSAWWTARDGAVIDVPAPDELHWFARRP